MGEGFITFMRKPGSSLDVEDIVDERLVVKLDMEGFIDRIYK